MGADAIGFCLALLAVGTTMVAIKTRFILFTLGACGLWAALMAYIIDNTTSSDNFHPIFILAAITLIIATLYIGVGRGTPVEGERAPPGAIARYLAKQFRGEPSDVIEESSDNVEYRNKVRKALHKGEKKRKQ